MVILVMLLAAVFERARDARSDRPPFFIHIDEFQNMLTSALVPLLSEGRKYGLGLSLAHQYVGQLEPRIMDAILGNVGTHVSFRVGMRDAERVASSPELEAEALAARKAFPRLASVSSWLEPSHFDDVFDFGLELLLEALQRGPQASGGPTGRGRAKRA